MSKKSIKVVNGIYKVVMVSLAVVIGIGAMIYNPGHLFTASLIYALGINSEFKSKDANKFDLR